MESLFKYVLVYYRGQPETELHAELESSGELLDMLLFGVLRQPQRPA